MVVNLTKSEIFVEVVNNSIEHRVINNFISRYFSHVLKLSNTTIIFNRDNELNNRRYFLHWVYSAYKKHNKTVDNNYLKKLYSFTALPFKIKIVGNKSIVQKIGIKLSILSVNTMKLTIDASNNIPMTYFAFLFKDHTITTILNSIVIETNQNTVDELKRVLDRKKLLGLPVFFTYNQKLVESIFSRYKQTKKRSFNWNNREKHTNHQDEYSQDKELLINSFKILECSANDPKAKVKESYIKLVKEFHPDKVYGSSEDIVKDYTKKFQKIREAYSVIQNHYVKEKEIV